MKIFSKKYLAVAAILAVVLVLVLPEIANGSFFSIDNLLFRAVAKFVFGIVWLIDWVAKVVISVEVWVIGFVLKVSTGIINSPPVRAGFPVVLAFTNLAFVLALVVVAIATIVRLQSYAMKQTLWKLIVAAVVVNFGLIIAGGILQFTDSLSFYFLDTVRGANTPTANMGAGVEKFTNFASSLGGALYPQRQSIQPSSAFSGTAGGQSEEQLRKAFNDDEQSFGGLGSLIGTVLFALFSSIFSIIILGVFVVMLIIRYVYIAYLLIILPIAWAGWIFPATAQYASKWWHSFFQQAFFAPIVLFFMWVAIQASNAMYNSNAFEVNVFTSKDQNPQLGGILGSLGDEAGGILEQLMKVSVILGIMLGGMITAQSMGMKLAGTAVGAAQGTAAGFGNWTKRKGTQYSSAALRYKRSPEGKSMMERMQERASKAPLPLRWAAGLALRPAARFAAAGGSRLYEQESADIRKSGMTAAEAQVHVLSAGGARRAALLSFLAEKDALDKVPAAVSVAKGAKSLFTNLGIASKFKSVQAGAGMSTEMYEAAKSGASQDEINGFAKEFLTSLRPQELAKLPIDELFEGKEKFGLEAGTVQNLSTSIAHAIAAVRPAAISQILPNIKGSTMTKFETVYRAEAGAMPNAAQRLEYMDNAVAAFTTGLRPTGAPAAGATTPAAAAVAPAPPPAGGGAATP